jgi:hypothetical protein
MRILDGKNSDPGSGTKKVGSWIRDKHPGSATLRVKGIVWILPAPFPDLDFESRRLIQPRTEEEAKSKIIFSNLTHNFH